MSRTIDERVVEMRFNNQQFERNAQTSISTLGKLKESLNLSGASKGLENISYAAKRVDMGGISNGIETVRTKFSALEVMSVTALANITNSAVNAGKRIASALTIDPIKTGFQEYETQINAVQTILANTESKGSTLKDVNSALDELNTYADKTIYNFTEMTRNIGTFTAAGVDLDTSVSAIKGIANLAAVSGSTSQQASTAMYQLSQALASGTVKLMDWNSVVNAGMGGQVFQDALKETARVHGIAIDDMIKSEGSFRETLQNGWLSSEILTETLATFTGDLSKEQLKQMGYTDEQIKKILKMGQTANDAATKVKTFTQLFDTLKEAAQSGWTQTWEILIGDFEEAKALLTEISDVVSALIGKSADSRNKMLQGWKDMGGRTDMIDAFRNSFEALAAIIKPINEAFREIFPPTTSEQLYNITSAIKSFTEKLKVSDETADKIKNTFKGVFSIFDMFRKVLVMVGKAIGGIFSGGGVTGVLDLILIITAAIGDFFTSLNSGFKTDGISKSVTGIFTGISEVIKKAAGGLESFEDILSKVGSGIAKVTKAIFGGIEKAFSWLSDNVSAGVMFAGLAGGGIFRAAKKFSGVMNEIKETIKNLFDGNGEELAGLKKNFADVLDSVRDTLQEFIGGIKANSLLAIASAVGILSMSLKSIAELSVSDISKSQLAIAGLMTMLNLSFGSILKSLSKFPAKGIFKASAALVLMATSIKILASAMEKIGSLKLQEVAKGLIGIGGGMYILTRGLKAIDNVKINLRTTISMIALAKSCEMLGDALSKFGSMSWKEISKGLVGMGGALGEMMLVVKGMEKISGGKSIFGSVGLLIAVKSLSKLSSGLKKIGSMSWKEIAKGLSGMGGALTEIESVTSAMSKIGGFSSIFGAASINIVVSSLSELADGLMKFGSMKWKEIARGLVGMGGALLEVAGISRTLGKLSGFSGILGSGAILMTIQGLGDLSEALKKFGSMSWKEIAKGLSGMGGALLEVASVSGALGKIAGFSGLLGSGSILIAVQGLGKLADTFNIFGGMTWSEIARGLVGMGGALTEVGVITGSLGYLTNFAGLLGSASIWTAVQGLGDLANAFKKFGEMSWDEIKKGLAAMGNALGELALGSLLNTLSIIGSFSISEVAEPLGVLADSLKKWNDVEIPKGLGLKLSTLAQGVAAFTFDILGAASISIVAEPLGILADSIKKWSGVSVPEGIGEGLSNLASGVRKFTFDSAGAKSIAIVAEPLGALADSAKKWSGVSVPENLKTGLTSLADGVAAFSFAFVGGWSMSSIIGPLGNLAGAVSKWKGVSIPGTIKTGLTTLSDGIKSFTWAFMGAWSLNKIVGPLGSLASSVKKWKGVSIPSGIGDDLKELAGGIKSFKTFNSGSITTVTDGFETMASSISKLSHVDLKTVTSGLNSFGTFMNKLKADAKGMGSIGTNIVNKLINPIKNSASKLSSAGKTMMNSLIKGITSRQTAVGTTMSKSVGKAALMVTSKKGAFMSAGAKLSSALASGMGKGSAKIKSSILKSLSSVTTAIHGYYVHFYSSGSYLVSGFANGISANTFKAEAKAREMARAAKKAAKKELRERSPSKEGYEIGDYFGIGFTNGIGNNVKTAFSVGSEMAKSAKNGLNETVSRLRRVIDTDMNLEPSIRPILDLSNVKSGAGSIGAMIGNPSLEVMSNVGSISTLMNRQNGANDDIISALNKLRGDLDNTRGDTYVIDGVTYDDGSNITDAVKTLVRAAKVERRR